MEKILLVDKPIGWTSFDVVAKIRGAIKLSYLKNGIKPTKRQLKVGHAGTLDPFASGLLIILLGDACKRAGDFLKLDKSYEFTAEIGKTSTTGDTEGDISAVSTVRPTLEQVDVVLGNFRGTITQTPPAYSAIKINGKRAYALAREGKTFDIPSREVRVNELTLQMYDYPMLSAYCSVSSGTYIRTLAEDIGKTLNVGAYCRDLRRITIGEYTIESALSIESTLDSIIDNL
jgi:tRNA pseudouridine55 synthase